MATPRAEKGFAIRKSKSDQVRQGREVGIPLGGSTNTCPVRALHAWLEASEIEHGPVFRPVNRHGQMLAVRRSDRAVAEVMKRTIRAAGKSARGCLMGLRDHARDSVMDLLGIRLVET